MEKKDALHSDISHTVDNLMLFQGYTYTEIAKALREEAQALEDFEAEYVEFED